MARTLRTLLIAVLGALAFSGAAQAAGGNYVFDGGTARQQGQVQAALKASSFNWSLVPAQITIHIAPGTDSRASVGQLWLDADLLDSGMFSWGVVQHEYAHQVDFFLIDQAERTSLIAKLGGKSWFQTPSAPLEHEQLGSERFASTLAWAYWQSSNNSMKPESKRDESAAMAPKKFRALVKKTLNAPGIVAMATP